MFVLGLLLFKRVGTIIFLVAVFSPMIMVMLVSLICRLAYDWGEKMFSKEFGFWPHYNMPGVGSLQERMVLGILKSRALLVEESFAIYPSRASEAKTNFWKAWQLAKIFGFPVFKSWKTHANFKAD